MLQKTRFKWLLSNAIFPCTRAHTHIHTHSPSPHTPHTSSRINSASQPPASSSWFIDTRGVENSCSMGCQKTKKRPARPRHLTSQPPELELDWGRPRLLSVCKGWQTTNRVGDSTSIDCVPFEKAPILPSTELTFTLLAYFRLIYLLNWVPAGAYSRGCTNNQ